MGLFLAVSRELATSSRSQDQGSASRSRGFTLIELMIAAAVVAILAAVAYPSYTSHLRKAYRAAAQSYLMDLAQKQTQYLLDNRAYAPTEAALNATAPADVSKYYDIGIAVCILPCPPAPPSFLITAAPKGTMASDATLTINQAGQKMPSDKW
jgi:type IV pilus assembly protein PilE